jgi:phosphate uptake regulator
METRKIQKTGGSSLIMTLPKKWVDQNGLQDKDLVKVSISGPHALILRPLNNQKQTQKSFLKLDGLSKNVLTRELIAHYISGVDEIVVESERIFPEQRNNIRSLSNFLTGFEIIDESAEKIVLRNIFDPTKFPITKNIEKMFFTTKSMFQDALKALMENDKALGRDVIERDFEIDKLYLIIKRQRHSLSQDKISPEDIGLTLSELQYYEDVAVQLVRIGDHAVKIARVVEKLDKKFTKVEDKITGLLNKANEMVKKLDKGLAHEILNVNTEPKGPIPTDLDPEEAFVVNLLEDSLDRVQGYATNIAEITIDQAVEKENK